jgi:hypothetical protein
MGRRRELRKYLGLQIGMDTFSPTAKAEEQAIASGMPDRRLSLGSPHTKTRRVHQLCNGHCTRSPRHCGGRYWSNVFPLSMVQKNDNTQRIATGIKRAMRIKERGW